MPDRRPLRPRSFVRASGARQIDVPPYANGTRLDAFLARYADEKSRSEWQKLIESGGVTLEGRRVRPSDRVAGGQRVFVENAALPRIEPRPAADIPLTIVYQDAAMIVVNKPPGLVVHPAPGHEEGTLVNALLARFPDLADPSGEQRPGIVHRLDKDTSGLIVIGRTTAAMAALQQQFKDRTAHKHYLLLVQGDLGEDEAAIEVPIGRDQRDRKKMSAQHGGREARTQFTVLERYGDFTLVEADLQSGRTHQLRVHFQFIGHPVAGDRTYGNGRGPSGLRRQFVHASYMKIVSPLDGAERELWAPLPNDLRSPLERLRAIRGMAADTLPAQVLGAPAGTTETLEVLLVPGQPLPKPSSPGRRSSGPRDGARPPQRRPSGSRPASDRSRGPRSSSSRPKRGPARD